MSRDLKVVSAAILTWALGEGLFRSLSPLYLAELGAAPEMIGLLAALFSLAQAAAMIPSGIASDRWGARRILVAGWLAALVATLVMAASSELAHYSVGYIGYGLTSWVLPPLASTIASGRGDLTPERAFSRVYSFYWAGMIVSPTLGGMIGESYGIRTTYWVAAALFSVSVLVIIRLRPGASPPQDSGNTRYSNLLRQPNYLTFLVIVFLVSFVLWLGMPLAPNFLRERWDIPISRIGALSSVTSLGSVLLALYLGGKRPRRALLVLQAATLGYLAILLTRGELGWLALAFFLQSGSGIVGQSMDAISTRVVKVSQLGLAYALNGTIARAASVVASALAGLCYGIRPALPFQLGLLLIPLVAGLTWRFAPRSGDGASNRIEGPASAGQNEIQGESGG